MPIYDFKCEQCSAVAERIVSSDIEAIMCPSTEHEALAYRMISCPGIVRIAGVGVPAPLGKRSERIMEPVWRDQETGNVTSMY